MNTNDTSISLRTSHDLRGPLINIQGFSGQVSSAVEQIHGLADKHAANLPPEFCSELAKLLDDDVKPCMEYLEGAIALLERRIRQLRTTGEMDYGTGSMSE